MTSKPVAFLLADLGVTQSHSRPHVSQRQPVLRGAVQDPQVPAVLPRAVHLDRACTRALQEFFRWYNDEHRHGGLGLHTPADIHHGHAPAIQAQRARVLTGAYRAHPERFVRKPPTPPDLPGAALINPPQKKEAATQ